MALSATWEGAEVCGIAGIWSTNRAALDLIGQMTDRLQHRGPDDRGTWADPDAGIALGHRRLSIVDLSVNGHQPMQSADGRWVLTYNGEIYNHRELRSELDREGRAPTGGWRGGSDTETFLQFVCERGIEETLDRSVGMFAFALWDRRDRRLILGRDRFGEKPLYYGWIGKDFVFASELKALTVHRGFERQLCPEAVETFLARTYIPAPLTIYRGLFKLPPATIAEVRREALDAPLYRPPVEGKHYAGFSSAAYWNYAKVIDAGLSDPVERAEDAIAGLDEVLGQAIRGQSIADVPVGVFLSGGIDSATVAALYQQHSGSRVQSFTIGFDEPGFNEADDAKAVAEFLGTDHHEHYVTPQEAMTVIPSLPEMFDEPFADPSQIPTFLVSKFARQKVKVALTGDGGDELFSGYQRYGDAEKLWRSLGSLPPGLRHKAGRAIARVPGSVWNKFSAIARVPPHRRLGSRIGKAARIAGAASSFDDVYVSLLHQWPFETQPTGARGLSGRSFDLGGEWPDSIRAMYADIRAYLPDDILCKVDRASMAVSLESRTPFLDHRVAEFAARIPLSLKRSRGKGKLIVRSLLERYIPRRLFDRPKSGFALPVGEWLKGPLREWAENLLDPASMAAEGCLDPQIVQARWQKHLTGERQSAEAIWAILMFQAWLKSECAQSAHSSVPAAHA